MMDMQLLVSERHVQCRNDNMVCRDHINRRSDKRSSSNRISKISEIVHATKNECTINIG